MRMLPFLGTLLLSGAAWPGAAWADSHAVTVVNRTSETIRRVQIAPAGAASFGENRLRSSLPANAEARITYSTGCPVDVRLGFEGGRTEEHLALDACTDPRVVTGEGGSRPAAAPPGGSRPRGAAASRTATPAHAPAIAPVVVPPWTGRSITRRFGGMTD